MIYQVRPTMALQTIILLSSSCLLSGMIFAQQSQSKTSYPGPTSVSDFDIDSRRPLNDALLMIEDWLHVPINYEEAIITDRTQLIAEEEVGLGKGLLFPRGGRLTVHYVPGETDALSAIQTTLQSHDQANLAGRYAVVRGESAFFVYPSSSSSLFASKISLPVTERTVGETIEEIAKHLALSSSKQVATLNQPYTAPEKISFGAQSETLLSVIERFNALVGPTSFRFIYDPPQKIYYLNIEAVPLFVPGMTTETNSLQGEKTKLTSSPFFVKSQHQ